MDLLDRIGHELKNASWATSGFTEMALSALQKRQTDRLLQNLASIREAIERFEWVLGEFEAAARVKAKRHGPDAGPACLARAYAVARQRVASVHPDGAHRLPAELPSAPLPCHPVVLTHVVFHLVENGLLYSTGPVELRTRTRDGVAILEVEDGGGTCPAGDRALWLEPGYSGSGRMGIGLKLAADFAAACGGGLELGSGRGDGTLVRLRLPEPAAAPGGAGTAPRVPPPRVAIFMDDQPINRQLVLRVLEAGGWKVHLASDGREGLELATRVPADVVLLDLRMPGLDGLPVAQELAARGVGALRVAYTATEPRELGERPEYRAAFDAFLEKGANAAGLARSLDALLGSTPPRVTDDDLARLDGGLAELAAARDPGERRALAARLLPLARRLAGPGGEGGTR